MMPELPLATRTKILFCAVAAIVFGSGGSRLHAGETSAPVVRAVLFFSPTCPHCSTVREEVLPPLAARYGAKLQIAVVSIATPAGYELFLSACMKHGLLRLSVPLLIVGNTPMVGADEIPLKFPDLIARYIGAGGVDWPSIPGLSTMIEAKPAFAPDAQPPAAESVTAESAADGGDAETEAKRSPVKAEKATAEKPLAQTEKADAPPSLPFIKPNTQKPELASAGQGRRKSSVSSTSPAAAKESVVAGAMPPPPAGQTGPSGIIDLTAGEEEAGILGRIRRDIYGNGVAILVLTGIVLTLLVSPIMLRKPAIVENPILRPRYDWLIPLLTLAGLGVAAYLSHVEVRHVEAVCGPVGDCNIVNQSAYARLFGVVPIGVLGLLGFLAILAAWIVRRWGSGRISLWAGAAILCMTGFGTLFSVYLTFLEPFVIGATCLWCLSSAVIMTTLYALALKPGCRAWSALAPANRPIPRAQFPKPVKRV